MLDIKQILSSNNIPFKEHGENVSKNNVNLSCIFCNQTSDPDGSFHLGINLTSLYWGCWRNHLHRGKNIYRLLRALNLNVTENTYNPSELGAILDGSFFKKSEEKIVKYTTLPKEFTMINSSGLDQHYKRYLKSRGFDNPNTVIHKSGLLRSKDQSSKWHHRLIIPVYVNDEVSWTGRSIDPNESIRYLSPEKGEARNIKHCLFNFNYLLENEAKYLVITEGPLDSLKCDHYSSTDFMATCLFGMVISEEQIALLRLLTPNFEKVLIATDQGTHIQALTIARAISFCKPIILNLPVKDLGEMQAEDINIFLEREVEQYDA